VTELAMSERVRTAIGGLVEAITAEQLSAEDRRDIVEQVRKRVLPRRRRKNPGLDAAYEDYLEGMRGIELFRKHIPDFSKKGHYQRQADQRRMMNGIHQRLSRERKRGRAANPDRALESSG